MKRIVLALVVFSLFAGPAYSAPKRSSSTSKRSTSSSEDKKKAVHAKSYTKKNGTKVSAYNRRPSGTASRKGSSTKVAGSSSRRSTSTAVSAQRAGNGRIKRSTRAKDDFKRAHPCPSTGKSSGPCKGYVIDHITPLARGGADSPNNMQWQTVAESKAKDKWERKARR